MKLSSFHEKRYGSWAGNPAGKKADPERCCVQVQEPGGEPTEKDPERFVKIDEELKRFIEDYAKRHIPTQGSS